MKKWILVAALLFSSRAVFAQVSFSARVHLPLAVAPLFSLTVDGEDTVRYCRPDSTSTIRFDNIAIGSRCHLQLIELGLWFDYPVFTITADTHIDSLVMEMQKKSMSKYEDVFWTKVQKDTTLRNRAARWTRDVYGWDTIRFESGDWIVGEPHSLKLARLYYADWIAPLSLWRTWPQAADSAYRYCLLASEEHPFLYYPLRQLAQHLGKTLVANPPGEPDRHTYFPQPEMPDGWWSDTTVDLFTPWEQHENENACARKYTLGNAGEESLCYPLADDGTVRYVVSDPMGITTVYRVEGGQIHRIAIYGWSDNVRIEREYYSLTAGELDSVAMAVADFQRAGRPADERGIYVIDGADFHLEYIVDGRYHCYFTSDGAVPPQFDALMKLLRRIYRRYH